MPKGSFQPASFAKDSLMIAVFAVSEKKSFEEAIQFANTAAAISVTRLGAQASAPYRNEVALAVE